MGVENPRAELHHNIRFVILVLTVIGHSLILVFFTIALRRPQPSGWGKWAFLAVPISAGIVFGALTIGQMGPNYIADCWFVDSTGIAATLTGAQVALCILYNLILVAILTIKLSRETAETSKMLSGKGNADQVKSTVDRVSNRMILYPIITLMCGGTGVVTQLFATDPDVIAFGYMMVSFEGILSFVAFFVLDPSANNMATKLIADLGSHRSPIAPYVLRYVQAFSRLNVAAWEQKPKGNGSSANQSASAASSSVASSTGIKKSSANPAHAERPISMGNMGSERKVSIAGTNPTVIKTADQQVDAIQEEIGKDISPRENASL
ncbi:hypothetical protein HDU93_001502 [Gonapodya sp. JEL0774]|nr:hypothetical protein HDU93_001502 [Gonapodya sp. JEL0774]